jgi:hypothetical protein
MFLEATPDPLLPDMVYDDDVWFVTGNYFFYSFIFSLIPQRYTFTLFVFSILVLVFSLLILIFFLGHFYKSFYSI